MSWIKAYGLLLLALTAVNYLLGLRIAGAKTLKWRRLFLIVSITVNLGCLAVFKYTNFLAEALLEAQSWLNRLFHLPFSIDPGILPLPVMLPLGISFFVFEFIHYVSDVYRGHKPLTSPLRFALFAAFFPSQIAGPIKRYQDFDKQLYEKPIFNSVNFEKGIWLIVQGLFKKAALGDNLAPLVQAGFADPLSMSALSAWTCVMAFALQIYYDFSGYTDIGRGSAMLLGFNLPENFHTPYLAVSLRDFWHRWHISLSTWLRDYLYIPLGGSKTTQLKAASNLLVTMLLGGLWHGASWHFVIWGGFHGLGLVLERLGQKLWVKLRLPEINAALPWQLPNRIFTLGFVAMGWVLFRADNLTQAGGVYGALFSFRILSTAHDPVFTRLWHSTLPTAGLVYMVALAAPIAWKKLSALMEPAHLRLLSLSRPVLPARIIFVAACCVLIVGLAAVKSSPFIYFQF